jgi:uncharacterized protein (TIGR00255 family)
MKSMTGYGEAAIQGRHTKVTVQLRTVNHRHLDIQIRGPREYLPLEEEMRQRIRERLPRGRVEVFITRHNLGAPSRAVELDEGLMRQFIRAWQHAKSRFGLKGELDLALFSNRPELFLIRELEMREKDEPGLVRRAFNSALKNLERSRLREGRHLHSDMRQQLRFLKSTCSSLTREAKAIRSRLVDPEYFKREAKAAESQRPELADGNFKGDIHEEVVRLGSHLQELDRVFRQPEPAGKRIDFLLQEAQRELNTIASKAPQLQVVRSVIDGKERVEKIREQAQNVE